jgi:asparagine synthase (glutamine-hydrolysing)
MCGIAGRLNFRSRAPVDVGLVHAMCDLIAHRGPDGEGVHVDGPVGLGHRRLAIIDLTDGGRQPMTDEGGRWVTFNGEIYNFLELRSELERLGHTFRSQSDTEVILAAYRQWGVDCLNRFRGMFAFAIWDSANQLLFIARDRLGKKPLHYWLDRDGLAFASEPKAFLADPGFEVRPDPVALSYYLSLQYVPAPMSAFTGVKKLPPAHYLTVRDGRIAVQRYWRIKYTPKRQISERDAIDEMMTRLREATRLRLISDVPLGAFLSGGIDSGTVVALMSELGRVKTFSIGFEEARYNELDAARLVATRYGTDHHEFIVRPDAISILPDLVWHYNEPYGDSSAIPTFYLAQVTRKSVTVALNGDAGDENFAGYHRYRANALAARYDRLPRVIRKAIETGARGLPAHSSIQLLSRVQRFMSALAEPQEQRYSRWMMHFYGPLKTEIVTPEFAQASGNADAIAWLASRYDQSDAPDFVDATLDVDVNTYLPDDLLVKVDIASMAHGLEARSPFLDHELMEFVASLPSGLKLRGSSKKYLLKRAVKHLLPPEILNRPKMGFGVPIDLWFRRDLRDFTRELLLGRAARARGYFRPAVVERLINEHVAATRNWHYLLWNLVMFELWHQRFVDSPPRRTQYTSTIHQPSTACP